MRQGLGALVIMILVGYLLIMVSAAPSNWESMMLFTAFFLGTQIPAILLSSRIGNRDALAISMAMAGIGAYLRQVNPYLNSAIIGAAMGIYFTSMVSVVGLALGVMGKTRHVIPSYVFLLSTGLLVSSLASNWGDEYGYMMAGGLLITGLIISLSPNIIKVHNIHLRQVVNNRDLLLVSIVMSVSWAYLMQLVPKLHGIDAVLMLPMIPAVILTKYLIKLFGIRRVMAVSFIGLGASGIYASLNLGAASIVGVFAVMVYMSILVMLSTLISPMLFTTSLAYIYEVSIPISILMEYAMINIIGMIGAAGMSCIAALLVLRMKEPSKVFEEKII